MLHPFSSDGLFDAFLTDHCEVFELLFLLFVGWLAWYCHLKLLNFKGTPDENGHLSSDLDLRALSPWGCTTQACCHACTNMGIYWSLCHVRARHAVWVGLLELEGRKFV